MNFPTSLLSLPSLPLLPSFSASHPSLLPTRGVINDPSGLVIRHHILHRLLGKREISVRAEHRDGEGHYGQRWGGISALILSGRGAHLVSSQSLGRSSKGLHLVLYCKLELRSGCLRVIQNTAAAHGTKGRETSTSDGMDPA